MKKLIVLLCAGLSTSLFAFAQQSNETPKAPKGKILFEQYCGSCHNFRVDGIGPQLGGLSSISDRKYLMAMITNAQDVIEAKNSRAVNLQKKFGTQMPSFEFLEAEERENILAYILEQPAPPSLSSRYGEPIKDPIPEKIQKTDKVLNIQHVYTIPPSSDKSPLTRIALMKTHPVSGETYISDLRGLIYRIKDHEPELFFDLRKEKPHFIDKPGLATGLGAFAFHPDFADNKTFYTTHTEAPKTARADFSLEDSTDVTLQWVLSEWQIKNENFPVMASSREMLRIDMVSGMHGVQEIAFKPQAQKGDEEYGLLYVSVGDGAAVEMGYPNVPHNEKGIWGCVIRIDPKGTNSRNGAYGIPASNPFVGTSRAAETYALGFRNPHRFIWTTAGQFLVTNIGQKQLESVNLVKPGYDFGWPYREGAFRIDELGDINEVYAIPEEELPNKYKEPVIEIDHDEMAAISTAVEYTGTAIPWLKGKYLFTSISQTKQYISDLADIKEGSRAEVKEIDIAVNGEITTFNKLTGNPGRADLRMGNDTEGEIYFYTKPDGKVYKVVP
ncbi:PQQ-dependent sugar dehydrogenase [Jiulongibacter sp. NS-SX5]|uniref:PQQ-dependent sugar dehydrogenase n=1 Tax=Jiulongibacter sp. NS-SX5 TaxID=3463854 RepID=UPI0040585463